MSMSKARQYKILEDGNAKWMFIDKHHRHTPTEYISYRQVICYALYRLMRLVSCA